MPPAAAVSARPAPTDPIALGADAPVAMRAGAPNAMPRAARVRSIDVLRGLVMIVMALDHTRDFFGNAAADPTNLATASAGLFLTRWITHFCAPVFFLLTGAGAYFSRGRRSPAELSRFLVSRGAWLMLLDFTVLRALLQFNIDYRVTILNVLWALGGSMIALAAISRLPMRGIVGVGVALIVLHDLADGVAASRFGALGPLWQVLHQPGLLVASSRAVVLLAYPVVPWIGVTAVGFALGHAFTWPAARRRALLLRLGLALCAAFVVLRALDAYGDPRPWTAQPTALRTALSFLNTTKYPPSLLFLLMTLGPALLVLRALDRRLDHGGADARPLPAALRPVLVFGRVPLFYFLLHFLIVHLLAVVVSAVRYGSVRGMFESPTLDRFPITQPPGWPLPLPWVYAAWVTVVLLAYPACWWYAALKARSTSRWLSYL
ncbi:MAG: DUF1624 domain-containing protein [Gemmatirosa sp.]|nr:DUF1624 domain-containing protein [Gemmatirosa sp.]